VASNGPGEGVHVTPTKTARHTRQGSLVRAALDDADHFRSAQSIHADLRASGASVGLSTVYRHLQALAEAGEADTLQTPDGEVLYRVCGRGRRHHHHLVCRGCGRTVEVEGRSVERWAEQVAADNGFHDVDHVVELLGVVRGLQQARGGELVSRVRGH
jgi:Fur family ferric uptake transcriptional regulator